MTVQPSIEWNKLGERPGRNSETWTFDGDGPNNLTFYGGIEAGKPRFREVDRKNSPCRDSDTRSCAAWMLEMG